jgi:effector-binding domain-containing protein
MSNLDVRIVNMEPMRVAVAHGFGPSPEAIASDKMLAFLAAKGLAFQDVRWFGFNNPDPSPGSPNYGYDVWATVGPEVEGEGDITIREVPARMYAVTRFKDLNNIGRVWQELVLWFEASPYKRPSYWHECLENLLVPPDTPFEEYEFDLYLPIRE